MKPLGVILGLAVSVLFFGLGWAAHSVHDYQLRAEPEQSLSLSGLFSLSEKPSPSDWITEEKIHVYKDRIVIDVHDARWAKFTDTNSMDPLFDETANTLKLMPGKPEDIGVGDIISYRTDNTVIIHRVVKTGYDEQGWYAITKGDNLSAQDPGRVRFGQITGVSFAIIY